MVLGKHEIEAALHAEKKEISEGRLKEDNPLDTSDDYQILCQACRRGDLRICQEKIQEGANVNARDRYDYTPLILASLCGHFEVVQLLLEAGALCERDTFQGERALYNALNDRIRNLLLSYDYSKSRDPLQPLAGHITSLLTRDVPSTSDIVISTDSSSLYLHKFILSARSPYFSKKLSAAPETTLWRVPSIIPAKSLGIAIEALYLKEVSVDVTANEADQATVLGIEKLGRQLEMGQLFEMILESDRRLQRQRRTDEVERGRNQLRNWFEQNIVRNRLTIDTDKADQVRWDKQNSIFADVLLCANEPQEGWHQSGLSGTVTPEKKTSLPVGIPLGPAKPDKQTARALRKPKSVLFPTHRAMLIRSEYFDAMFSSSFKEAQPSAHLPIVPVDCSPAVLEVVLQFLYTEGADFGLEIAIDVLFAADLLLIDKLKVKAATIISTLGNGTASVVEADNSRGEMDLEDIVGIYDVVRAGWITRVQRLEEFGARYIAYRLERYIDDDEFLVLVRESAARLRERQETDTIELIDDIRHYLSERFRLRFEDADLEDMMEEGGDLAPATLPDTEKNKGDVTSDTHSTRNGQSNGDGYATALGDTVGTIRTLDGEIAGDEFAQDALNYQILLEKIDQLLEKLHLDA